MPLTKEQDEALLAYAHCVAQVKEKQLQLADAKRRRAAAAAEVISFTSLETSLTMEEASSRLTADVAKEKLEEALGVKMAPAYRSLDNDARYSSREG